MTERPPRHRTGPLARLREQLRQSLWVLPTLTGLLAFALAEALVRAEERSGAGSSPLIFAGDADAARAVLSTIAGASMTVLGLTISLTLAVLTLAAQGYTARVLARFMRDRAVRAVVAALLATFTFSLGALRLVREDRVPGLTVNLSVALALGSLIGLIVFFHHIASEIRVERVIAVVWDETRGAVDRLPEAITGPEAAREATAPAPDLTATPVRATRTGRVVWVDDAALCAAAEHLGVTVEVVPALGDFVAEGEPLALLHGTGDVAPQEHPAVVRAIALGTQRTAGQDVAYGLRRLADLALRALSPGINDATTAHEAILRIADLLRRLAVRPLGTRVTAPDGAVLLLRPRPTWEDLVGESFDQLAAGAEAQADAATTLVLLDALARVAAAAHQPGRLGPLRDRAARLREGAHRAIAEPRELELIDRAAARV